jgi:hypothetical protein
MGPERARAAASRARSTAAGAAAGCEPGLTWHALEPHVLHAAVGLTASNCCYAGLGAPLQGDASARAAF